MGLCHDVVSTVVCALTLTGVCFIVTEHVCMYVRWECQVTVWCVCVSAASCMVVVGTFVCADVMHCCLSLPTANGRMCACACVHVCACVCMCVLVHACLHMLASCMEVAVAM